MKEIGNSEEDWKIFDILCQDFLCATPKCNPCNHCSDHVSHSLDLITSLRSELAAVTYKQEKLIKDLFECKNKLSTEQSDCDSLRAQTVRQSTLILTLQNRLQSSETRENDVLSQCDSTIENIQREKKIIEDKSEDLQELIKQLEDDLSNEKNQKNQVQTHLNGLIRRLFAALEIDSSGEDHQLPPSDFVESKIEKIITEVQKLKMKIASNSENLIKCEKELLNLKTNSTTEKQGLTRQIETLRQCNQDLEERSRQIDHDLQMTKNRLSEFEINNEKLLEELRGFESRSYRLQNALDRLQNDRYNFLETLASLVNSPEPCETMIKDKVREMISNNQTIQTQVQALKEQVNMENIKHKKNMDTLTCKLENIEQEKYLLEEKLEHHKQIYHNLQVECQHLRENLIRLSKVLFSDDSEGPRCSSASDLTTLAKSLLEKAEQLVIPCKHSSHDHNTADKNYWGHYHHHHPHLHHHDHHFDHHGSLKLSRRIKNIHDNLGKENSATLQKRLRILREQLHRRDLHLELLKKKIFLLEGGGGGSAKNKTLFQNERDEAIRHLKKTQKQAEKLSQHLLEAKTQLTEVRGQLSEAIEYKIAALEKSKKIDNLTGRICELEAVNSQLIEKIMELKDRLQGAVESSQEKHCKDQFLINTLKDDISRLQNQLLDANHRLSHLQQFRIDLIRMLHSRDIAKTDLLHKLQMMCNDLQQECKSHSSRCYKHNDSPSSTGHFGEYSCHKYTDDDDGDGDGGGGWGDDDILILPNVQCRPRSRTSSSGGGRTGAGGGGGEGGGQHQKRRQNHYHHYLENVRNDNIHSAGQSSTSNHRNNICSKQVLMQDLQGKYERKNVIGGNKIIENSMNLCRFNDSRKYKEHNFGSDC